MYEAINTLMLQAAFYASEIQIRSRQLEKIDATPEGQTPPWDKLATTNELSALRGKLESINEGLAKLQS